MLRVFPMYRKNLKNSGDVIVTIKINVTKATIRIWFLLVYKDLGKIIYPLERIELNK